MKKHAYFSNVQLTDDQLMISSTNAWITYAEQKQKSNNVSSPYTLWKCFNCSKSIRVHYKNNNCRSMYCKDCRPKVLKVTGIHLRYLMMFRNHVRAILINNSSMTDLFKG